MTALNQVHLECNAYFAAGCYTGRKAAAHLGESPGLEDPPTVERGMGLTRVREGNLRVLCNHFLCVVSGYDTLKTVFCMSNRVIGDFAPLLIPRWLTRRSSPIS